MKFVKMPVNKYIEEHKKLIKLLNSAHKLAFTKEALSQFREVLGRGLKF